MPTVIPRSRFIRTLVGVVVTIFLGAIGSGIWALFLGPGVEVLSRASIRLISSVFHGYLNFVYRQVSRNPADQLAMLPYLLFVVFIIIGPWVAIFQLRRGISRLQKDLESTSTGTPETATTADLDAKKAHLDERLKRLRRRISLLLIPLAAFSTVFYSEDIFETEHSRKAALFIERSIEIVAPFLDEHDRLDLRARFRSIESASEFYDLEDRLRAIAGQHSTKLPEFESVR